MAEEKKTKRKYTRKAKTEAVVSEQPVEQAEAVVEEAVVEEAVAEEVPTEVVADAPVEEPETVEVNPEVELLREQNEILKKQMEELKAQINNARPQVIQIANDTERIEFLWLAPVADDNEFLVADGLYGKITGKVGNFSVPKNEFSRILDSQTRKFIENRWLIVLGGLTDEERKMYGVDYKKGEVMDKDVFMRMLDIGKDIVDIYRDLCDASKAVVAKLYYEAWTDPNRRHKVKRETVVAMHKISSQPGIKAIIDEMNRADAE